MKKFPKSRDAEIVVQESVTELLIYDLNTNQAHCLNQTSAIIWQSCNGKSSISQLSCKLKIPQEVVLIAIYELQKKNLMKRNDDFELPSDLLSRRRILMKIGTTTALPLITSLIAPTAIQAQSGCIGNGETFDLISTPFFPTASDCVNALTSTAVMTCCSGTLNPAGGFTYSTSPPLCRGICG